MTYTPDEIRAAASIHDWVHNQYANGCGRLNGQDLREYADIVERGNALDEQVEELAIAYEMVAYNAPSPPGCCPTSESYRIARALLADGRWNRIDK